MITDDLSTLFDTGQPGVRFRQGTILTWDSNTGSNTIDLAGGTLTDVPIINTGEAIALKAGHVVGMLGQGSTWFVIGRITPPNDPNFAGASVAFGTDNAGTAGNFALSTSPVDVISGTIPVPTWADEALVLATGNCQLTNPRAVIDFATIQVSINGVGGGGVQTGFAPLGEASGNYVGSMATSSRAIISAPGPTITVATTLNAQGAAWSAQASNRANVDAIAVFRSIA